MVTTVRTVREAHSTLAGKDDLASYSSELFSLIERGTITLEEARKTLAEGWGIHIITTSTEEFVSELTDLI